MSLFVKIILIGLLGLMLKDLSSDTVESISTAGNASLERRI